MVVRCANRRCNAFRLDEEGKLYRLDLDVASKAGASEKRTEYLWLCADCARHFRPRVAVKGDTIQVILTPIPCHPPAHPLRPGLSLN